MSARILKVNARFMKRALKGVAFFAVVLFLSQVLTSRLIAQVIPARYEPSNSIDVSTSHESSSAESPSEDTVAPASAMDRPAVATSQGAAPSRESGLFESWNLAFIANTLGPGFDLSTPVARHFDVRGGANFLSIGPVFDVDGLHYNSDIHLRSGHLGLDWFPRHRNFRITGGILYFNNNVTAHTFVPAGQQFVLDDNTFTSGTDDPVHGDAGLDYSRHVAPLITVGFNNILPGRHRHISVPVEFGAAFTGSAKIATNLVGTACQQDGCFSFAENDEAQQSLKNQVKDINDTLSDIPVYPILSIGFAYRF
jgi:hypothetical protein